MTDDINAFRNRLQKDYNDECNITQYLLMTPEERKLCLTPEHIKEMEERLGGKNDD